MMMEKRHTGGKNKTKKLSINWARKRGRTGGRKGREEKKSVSPEMKRELKAKKGANVWFPTGFEARVQAI